MSDIGGFISAPIKLAAIINNRRRAEHKMEANSQSRLTGHQTAPVKDNLRRLALNKQFAANKTLFSYLHLCSAPNLANIFLLLLLLISSTQCLNNANTKLITNNNNNNQKQAAAAGDLMRHQDLMRYQREPHYLNINPSTHFNYNEGRQLTVPVAIENIHDNLERSQLGPEPQAMHQGRHHKHQHSTSHIYKRSSALISLAGTHYPPLVSSGMQPAALNPLSRRMMSEGAHNRWTQMNSEQQQSANEEQQLAELLALHLNNNSGPEDSSTAATTLAVSRKREHEEAELLRQKQHIQYHDQWPSVAGKCHKRTLNFCASVLPFNTTTFPNIIGDTNRFEVKRSLPFFGFLAKSSCNKRLDELLCLLLEPPCGVQSGVAIPPCKKFCRLALEGCNEYIPATLAMSSVFDCRQYPDSNDPSICINLAQGSKCAADEFKCPDKTCIPRNWLCDGVRDCIFAADEANCTALTGVGLQTSVCSTEEFKCDGKCVPKAWKCDGERDCLDGSDEEACDQRPRCGPDRFKCADGNGCLPKRWVCDGKAECRDGSDEMNCEQQECSENDFKCDNGICIPKLWRCDRQFDCKDGSDERGCIYPIGSTTLATPTTSTPLAVVGETDAASYLNVSIASVGKASGDEAPTMSHQQSSLDKQSPSLHVDDAQVNPVNYYANVDSSSSSSQQKQQQQSTLSSGRQQLESNLNEDISRIIQHESSSLLSPDVQFAADTQQQASTNAVASFMDAGSGQKQEQQQQQQKTATNHAAKELKKFDYDIIQSSSAPNLIQLNDLMASAEITNQPAQQQKVQKQQQLLTQIDFVPQQQQQAPALSRLQMTPASAVHADYQVQQMVFRGQQQQHQQDRGRAFGQTLNGSSATAAAVATTTPSKNDESPAPVGVERVPIYRSLFKTLKGGQGRAVGVSTANGHRYAIVTGRRRRERHNGSTTQSGDEPPAGRPFSHRTSVTPLTDVSSVNSAAPAHQQHQHPQQTNSTATSSSQSARANHGVASYLQLLNSRYNLRMARLPPQLPVRV